MSNTNCSAVLYCDIIPGLGFSQKSGGQYSLRYTLECTYYIDSCMKMLEKFLWPPWLPHHTSLVSNKLSRF